MQSKRILSVFLLSALLLLSACARQNPDPIVSTSSSCRAETSAEPVSPWIEPAEAAPIGELPSAGSYRYAALEPEVFTPGESLFGQEGRSCYPHIPQEGEVTFGKAVDSALQKSRYEEALSWLGSLSDLPRALYALGLSEDTEPLTVSLQESGALSLRLGSTPAGALSVAVLSSAEQAPEPLSAWLQKAQPDAQTIHAARQIRRVHTASGAVVEEESFFYLRREQRAGMLVLTFCTTGFTPTAAPAGEPVENAFGVKTPSQAFARQTFESALPKI